MLPPGVLRESEIKAAVEEVERLLYPKVKYIRYKLDRDWSGDWGIFFQVLLSDEANELGELHEITARVRRLLSERIDFPLFGIFPYHSFRTESEQKLLVDPAWA
jgi:hypothetical protein